MCVSLHASSMADTKLYAGEAMLDGKYVHVLGYQNSAENMHDGPNAMILPIPTDNFGSENAIDTRGFKNFLGDIAEATRGSLRFNSRGLKCAVAGGPVATVFDIGSYTVVVSTSAAAILKALRTIPENKRPKMNIQVVSAFSRLYRDWPLAVCCWDGTIMAEPLLFWYEPKYPKRLFAPALDAHDGQAPRPHSVLVDHIVMFGSTIRPTGLEDIHYGAGIPDHVKRLLPTRAIGQRLSDKLPNGDFWYNVDDLDGTTADRDGSWRPAHAFRAYPEDGITVPLGRGW